MKAVVWQERYKCNFKCPYCYAYQTPEDYERPKWEAWVEAFNRLQPDVIDITGGEPFLNKNLIDIIAGFRDGIKVGITTNLSQDVTEFVQRITPEKVISMTLSYHPTQAQMSRESFMGKALLLHNRGFQVTVNFVAYPEQMFLIHGMKGFFESTGVRFHVDPYCEPDGKPFPYSELERNLLQSVASPDRAYKLEETAKNVLCSAGMDYLQIDPEGNAHRCITYHYHKDGMKPLGNIFDKAFTWNTQKEFCAFGDKCGGCDRDKVTIEPIAVAGRG